MNLEFAKRIVRAGGTCSYFSTDVNDTEIGQNFFGDACHARMPICNKDRNGRPAGFVYTSLYNSGGNTPWPFWEFILDPALSPWKDVLKYGVEIYKGDEANNDRGAVRIALGPDTNPKHLVNLCIASRIPREYSERLIGFNAVVTAGINPISAAYIAGAYCSNAKGAIVGPAGGGHNFFSENRKSWPRFVTQSPEDDGSRYLQNGYYFPSDACWSRGSELFRRFDGFILDLHKGPVKEESSFGLYTERVRSAYGRKAYPSAVEMAQELLKLPL